MGSTGHVPGKASLRSAGSSLPPGEGWGGGAPQGSWGGLECHSGPHLARGPSGTSPWASAPLAGKMTPVVSRSSPRAPVWDSLSLILEPGTGGGRGNVPPPAVECDSRMRGSLRPRRPEHARSRLLSEAQQGRAGSVPGWETSQEDQVPEA